MRAYPHNPSKQGFRRTRGANIERSEFRSTRSSGPAEFALDTTGKVLNRPGSDSPETGPGLVKELENEKSAQEAKATLLLSLKGGDPICAKEAAKIASCRAYVSVGDTGQAEARVRSCGSRFCVFCFRREQRKKRLLLQSVFQRLNEEFSPKKYNYVFITLTLAPEKTSRDCKEKLTQLRKHLTRFFNTRTIKRINKGSYYRIETGKKNSHYHHHVHICLISESSRAAIDAAVKETWLLGSVIKVKRWRVEEEGTLCAEMTKGLSGYLMKPLDSKLAPDALRDIVSAFRSVKLNGSTGVIRKFMKDAREQLQNEPKPEVPAPPTLPADIELLPAGNYDRISLLEFAVKGSIHAVYCLRVLRHQSRYGVEFKGASP